MSKMYALRRSRQFSWVRSMISDGRCVCQMQPTQRSVQKKHGSSFLTGKNADTYNRHVEPLESSPEFVWRVFLILRNLQIEGSDARGLLDCLDTEDLLQGMIVSPLQDRYLTSTPYFVETSEKGIEIIV